jgi:NAD(P)-dependent dehydrogenase (short-subunit alcohol dehydrogenase family)
MLPGMRARGRGSVVMVGSLLAEFPLAFRSAYVASKCALRGFTLAARGELAPHGVRMSIVEPAYYRTGITGNRIMHRPPAGSAYEAAFAAVEAGTARGDARAGDPADVAMKILAIARTEDPAPVYAVGGVEPALLQLRRVLSNRAVEALLARRYGLGRARRR